MRGGPKYFCAAGLAVILLTVFARAEGALPEIRATFGPETEVIEALLVPPPAVGMKPRAVHREVSKVGNDPSRTEVRVDTKPEDYIPGTLFTIFSRSVAGRVSASPLRVLAEPEPAPEELPAACVGRAPDRRKLEALNVRSLEKLVAIRKKKKALLMERIRLTLTPETLDGLGALEADFGLDSGRPLSKALPDDELVSRILNLAVYSTSLR